MGGIIKMRQAERVCMANYRGPEELGKVEIGEN